MGWNGSVFEPTCAYAWWALMHCFLSGCDVTKILIGPKVTCQKMLIGQMNMSGCDVGVTITLCPSVWHWTKSHWTKSH